jgi:outer membrane autotransporter protein
VIGDERSFDVNFAGAASPFTLSTTEPSQSRFEVGTGFNVLAGNGFTLGFEYNAEFSGDYQSHGGFVRARLNF